jgi:hypothetical protein
MSREKSSSFDASVGNLSCSVLHIELQIVQMTLA